MQQLGTHNCSDRALRSLSRPADEEQEDDAVDAPENMTRLQQQELLSTSTPHGALFKRLQLPSEDEQTPVVLHYLDPSAMLSAMVAMVPSFWDLLKTLQSQFGNLLHIVLYQDGACAGQMLIVNPAKSCQLFYLSILELGINRHAQTDFWWTLACLPTRKMKDVLGGLSAVTRALLCQLQPMRDGVLVQGPTADDKLFLFLRAQGLHHRRERDAVDLALQRTACHMRSDQRLDTDTDSDTDADVDTCTRAGTHASAHTHTHTHRHT